MASTVKIKTRGNPTLEGLELENFSTEETLQALLDQFKIFSSGFTATTSDTKKKTEKSQTKIEKLLAGFTATTSDTKKKTEKSQTKIEKLLAGLTGGAIGAEATGSGKVGDVVTNIIGPTLKSFLPIGDVMEDFLALGPEVLLAVVAFKAISFALSIFQGALNLVSRSVTSIFFIAGIFVETLLSGKIAMSDYVAAVQRGTAKIPIIGTLTSILAAGMAYLETWNQSIIDLTKAGGNFGGSISFLAVSAADAGMTVEQFSKVIKENADRLATFGSVMNGVNIYTKVSKISMQEYSEQLSNLGISFADYSEELPKLLSIFGASMKAHGASDKDLALSAIQLTEQFDAMSQITGKSREQQAADLQKLTEDAAWQQKMTHMSGDEAARYAQVLSEIGSTSGNAYAELYKLTVLGMPPLTKELQTLLATTPGLNAEFQKMTNVVKSGAKGAALGAKLDDIAADIVSTGLKAGQSYEALIAASTAGLSGSASDIAAVQKDLLQGKQNFFRNGQFNEELYKQQLASDRKRLDTNNMISESLLKFSNVMTILRDSIFERVIGPLLHNVAPLISTITNEFSKANGPLQSIADMLVGLVSDFGSWIQQEVKNGGFKSGIDNFIKMISSAIKITIEVVKFVGGMIAWVINNWETIKTVSKLILDYVIFPILTIVGVITAIVGVATAVFLNAITPILVLGELIFKLVSLFTVVTAWISDKVSGWLGINTAEIGSDNKTSYLTTVHNDLSDNYKKSSEEQTQVSSQTPTLTNPLTLDSLQESIKNMHQTLQDHGRHLQTIAENTGTSAKFDRKTAASLA